MSSTKDSLLMEHFESAVRQFFADQDVVFQSLQKNLQPGPPLFNCLIEVKHSLLHGTVIFSTDRKFLIDSYPIASSTDLGDDVLMDWLGEMVNRIVGRFKNQLLPFNIDIEISPPSVTCEDVSLFSDGSEKSIRFCHIRGRNLGYQCLIEIDKSIDFGLKDDSVRTIDQGKIIYCQPEKKKDGGQMEIEYRDGFIHLKFASGLVGSVEVSKMKQGENRQLAIEGRKIEISRGLDGVRLEGEEVSIFLPTDYQQGFKEIS